MPNMTDIINEWLRENKEKYIRYIDEDKYEYTTEIPFRYGILSDNDIKIIAKTSTTGDSLITRNKLIITDGVKSGFISCIHLVANTTVEQVKNLRILDDEEQEKTTVEYMKSTEQQPISRFIIDPFEQFISLMSYADGIAELGAENILEIAYMGENYSNRPIGFNNYFQTQFLKAINKVLPYSSIPLLENVFKKMMVYNWEDFVQKNFPMYERTYHLSDLSKHSKFLETMITTIFPKTEESYIVYHNEKQLLDAFETQHSLKVNPMTVRYIDDSKSVAFKVYRNNTDCIIITHTEYKKSNEDMIKLTLEITPERVGDVYFFYNLLDKEKLYDKFSKEYKGRAETKRLEYIQRKLESLKDLTIKELVKLIDTDKIIKSVDSEKFSIYKNESITFFQDNYRCIIGRNINDD